ncbi:MAG: UbiX family flavin prenyltransferase [Turicibacter sp.]|nr:UbiX family flavin prenyltransferase [Turicibacter sp.]
MKTITVGITGASGSIYGLRLIEELAKNDFKIHVVATKTAEKVLTYETNHVLKDFINNLNAKGASIIHEDVDNFFAAIASGSYQTNGMVIAPCSMGTLAQIANGISSNLLIRAADVCLKERRPLIVLARETPLNTINLENMLKLTQAGGVVFPACPGFYSKPETIDDLIDFMIGKVLDALDIENDLFDRWGTE